MLEPAAPEGSNPTSEEHAQSSLISQSIEDLNPSANPLLFPTEADEVKIENLQAITLKEAIELGRRNNQDLQIAKTDSGTLSGSFTASPSGLNIPTPQHPSRF